MTCSWIYQVLKPIKPVSLVCKRSRVASILNARTSEFSLTDSFALATGSAISGRFMSPVSDVFHAIEHLLTGRFSSGTIGLVLGRVMAAL